MRLTSNSVHAQRHLALLAPSQSVVPAGLRRVSVDPAKHYALLKDLQQLRGRVYVEDGAISASQLDSEGRHRQEADDRSWHLLVLDGQGLVHGCARYLCHDHQVSFQRLGVHNSHLAQCDRWGHKLRQAVDSEIHRAKQMERVFVELGGWALSAELRCTTEALRVMIGSYALGRQMGGALGLTTATVRHGSSSILRRIGGSSLVADNVELPQYFDPQYQCEMEILRFDSSSLNPRYEPLVAELQNQLPTIPVICRTGMDSWSESLLRLGAAVRSPEPVPATVYAQGPMNAPVWSAR